MKPTEPLKIGFGFGASDLGLVFTSRRVLGLEVGGPRKPLNLHLDPRSI